MPSHRPLIAGLLLGWLPALPAAHAVVGISVDDAVVQDGRAVVDVRLATGGAVVGGVQNDLLWDATAVQLERVSDCRINPEIGDRLDSCTEDPLPATSPCKTLSRNLVSCGAFPQAPGCAGQSATTTRFRSIVAATGIPNNNPIPDGTVLYTCTFTVADAGALPVLLINENGVASDPWGERLAAAADDGSILAFAGQPVPSRAPSATPTMSRTPTPTPTRTSTLTPLPTRTRPPSRTPTPTATVAPTLPPDTPDGERCTTNAQCFSGSCLHGVCCEAPSCEGWQRCDLRGSEGQCAEPLGPGESCIRNSECRSQRCDTVRGTCVAQEPLPDWVEHAGPISWIVGPPADVPQSPRSIAVGDVNGDWVADAVVAMERSTDVIALLADLGGVFSRVVGSDIGTSLRAVQLGRLDGDARPDLAAIDDDGAVLVAHGLGDGRFGEPVFLDRTTGARAIALADVDVDGDVDIVTANGAGAAVSVFLNTDDTGFRLLDDGYPTAASVDSIAVADFNRDGFPDLALIDSASRDDDEVTVMLNNGGGRFLQVSEHTVAAGAVGLTVADINDDGNSDIVILGDGGDGQPGVLQDRYTLSVLLGSGSGLFRAVVPAVVSCPRAFNGAAITCAPRAIEAADMNRDGLVDVAVAVAFRMADSSEAVLPGLVDGHIGLGDGTFAFSASVQVGARPHDLAIGDMTGDGLMDLAVAEGGGWEGSSPSVSIARQVPPPPREIGGRCLLPSQCNTGACVDYVCCESTCEAGQRCDLPGAFGSCHAPAVDGARCQQAAHCASGSCVDGFCCVSPGCAGGEYCNTGSCAPPAGLGVGCSSDEQCGTAACTDGVCCGVDACDSGWSCAVSGLEGVCAPLPTATPMPTATPTPKPAGYPCEETDECESGFCVDGHCCRAAFCPPNQYCSIAGAAGACAPRRAPGANCNQDSDCHSNNCDLNLPNGGLAGVCGTLRTPTPVWWAHCSSVDDCPGGFFCNELEGWICCDRAECPDGQTCRDPANPGFCTQLPTPTPSRLPQPARCAPDRPEDCSSGICIDGVCCESPTCANAESRDDGCALARPEQSRHGAWLVILGTLVLVGLRRTATLRRSATK